MARRRVTCVRRDSGRDTTDICNPDSAWSIRTKAQAIHEIENGEHVYYVESGGKETVIDVVDDPDGKYLRTRGDSTTKNNLDDLSTC